MYMSVFASLFVCVIYVPVALGGQKKASDLLELKLQTVASHHMGSGN